MSWKLRYYLNDELFLEEIHPTRADVIRVACEKFPMHIRAPNYCWQDLRENGYADLGSGGVVIIDEDVPGPIEMPSDIGENPHENPHENPANQTDDDDVPL